MEQSESILIEKIILQGILDGNKVILPGFGYLEIVELPNKKSVLFRNSKTTEDPVSTENAQLFESLSRSLKTGEKVRFPQVGTFQALKNEKDEYRISFVQSPELKNMLNQQTATQARPAGQRAETLIKAEKKEAVNPIEEPVLREEIFIKTEPIESLNSTKEEVLEEIVVVEPVEVPEAMTEPEPVEKVITPAEETPAVEQGETPERTMATEIKPKEEVNNSTPNPDSGNIIISKIGKEEKKSKATLYFFLILIAIVAILFYIFYMNPRGNNSTDDTREVNGIFSQYEAGGQAKTDFSAYSL